MDLKPIFPLLFYLKMYHSRFFNWHTSNLLQKFSKGGPGYFFM